MGEKEKAKGDAVEKINALNEIFKDVISDATDFIKDLSWSVKNYLLFGLVTILFGISEIAYGMEVMQDRYYIPLFIAGVLIFAGAAQIYRYFRLRKKYSKLLGILEELKKA